MLIQNMILDIYKGCFSRIYFFVSPSIDIDQTWQPVKSYISKELHVNDKEQIYFDHYDPDDLQKIIDTQYKVVDYMKTHKFRKNS